MSQLKLIANHKKLEKYIIKVDKNKLTNSNWQCFEEIFDEKPQRIFRSLT